MLFPAGVKGMYFAGSGLNEVTIIRRMDLAEDTGKLPVHLAVG